MTCRQCKKLIQAYLGGELKNLREIKNHIAHCRECQSFFEQMVSIKRNLMQEEKRVPDGFRTKWESALIHHSVKKKKVRYQILIPALAGALCCIFVITAFATGGFTIYSQNSSIMASTFANEEAAAEDNPEEMSPEIAAEEQEAQSASPSEAAGQSEITEGTTDSSSADSSESGNTEGKWSADTGTFKAYGAAEPERLTAGEHISMADFLKRADELKISYQADSKTVLLTEDGSGNIDVVLHEFGMKRSGLQDVAIEFILA